VGNLQQIAVIGEAEFNDNVNILGNLNVHSNINLNLGSVYRIDDIEILSETTLADCVLYSNLNKVGNLDNLNVIGDIYANFIDTYDINGTLNIATQNASVINIGSAGGTVNILSNLNYIETNCVSAIRSLNFTSETIKINAPCQSVPPR
jgi:hypothetical protein